MLVDQNLYHTESYRFNHFKSTNILLKWLNVIKKKHPYLSFRKNWDPNTSNPPVLELNCGKIRPKISSVSPAE